MMSIDSETFPTWWHERAKKINDNARNKGFWDNERNDAEMFDLVHSELSEAAEALWQNNPRAKKIPDFTCVEEELADAVIRLMDQTYARNWNVVPLVLYYDASRSWFEKELGGLNVNYPAAQWDPEGVLLRAHYTLSMALEDLRHNRDPSIWLAKTLVLLFRLGRLSSAEPNGEYRTWDLYAAIDAKMTYNTTRPHKHGKNF